MASSTLGLKQDGGRLRERLSGEPEPESKVATTAAADQPRRGLQRTTSEHTGLPLPSGDGESYAIAEDIAYARA